jgi:hypothetical protein
MKNTNTAAVCRKKPTLLDIRNIAQMGILAAIAFVLESLADSRMVCSRLLPN